jgi:hypothetical protein
MGVTKVYFDTIQFSNLFGMQSFNNPGGPGTSEVQGVNPYLKPVGNDGGLVGFTAAKGGDGDGNVGADAPPYALTNPVPNKLLLLAGDQQWGPRTYPNGTLPEYDPIPPGAGITDLVFAVDLDTTFADTWRIVMKIGGTEYFVSMPGNLGSGFFNTQSIPLNPATGTPWTRAQIFSTEWGYEIQTSALAGTVASSHFWWPFFGSAVTNVWYTWFAAGEMYLEVTFSDNNSVTITGSGGLAEDGGIVGGGFDLSGLHLGISGGAGGDGGGGTGHSAPTAGCPPDFPTGPDSGGIAGCALDFDVGSP